MSIKEGNKRIMLTIDPQTEEIIEILKKTFNTKQTSKAIKLALGVLVIKTIKEQAK